MSGTDGERDDTAQLCDNSGPIVMSEIGGERVDTDEG